MSNIHPYPLTLYIDGACPMCAAEARMLASRDRHQRLRFVDIADPAFTAPGDGPAFAALWLTLHARWADGRWVAGVATFRAAYAAVGLGWLAMPTGWPLVSRIADHLYAAFARRRHALPGWLVRGLVAVARAGTDARATAAARQPRCHDGHCRL